MPSPHITEFYAENVKRLRVVRITPDGALVQIAGPNGSGKSSVLDAIFWALAGKSGVEPHPIRRGAETARVTLTLGDVTVTREWKEVDGETKTELRVEAASGARFPSPQKMLDELLGASALTFDPLAFDRMKPKEQLLELQKVAPLPPKVLDWRHVSAENFAERTNLSRRLRDLKGKLDGRAAIPAGLTLEQVQPIDTKPLLDRMAKLSLAAEAYAAAHTAQKTQREMIRQQIEAAEAKRAQAKRLLEEADHIEQQADEMLEALDKLQLPPKPEDAAALTAELSRIEAENRARAEARETLALMDEAKALADQVAACTTRIETADEEAARLIAAAEMPVAGLSYGEEGVLFDGLPLEQASGAERLRVALGIAMAAQPKLRIVRIKDGSLLDEQSLKLVAEMAEAKGYQVWIERVDTSGKVGVVMADGEVAHVH